MSGCRIHKTTSRMCKIPPLPTAWGKLSFIHRGFGGKVACSWKAGERHPIGCLQSPESIPWIRANGSAQASIQNFTVRTVNKTFIVQLTQVRLHNCRLCRKAGLLLILKYSPTKNGDTTQQKLFFTLREKAHQITWPASTDLWPGFSTDMLTIVSAIYNLWENIATVPKTTAWFLFIF